MAESYLKFRKVSASDGIYYDVRNQKGEVLGYIDRSRVGRFMHWCLETIDGIVFSNGCLKEISAFITTLYGNDRKGGA